MALSRQSRIIILLVIDTIFFFVELITGYTVGSLALVADSFHMLNDVLSLVVALYTIKLARSPSSSENSYGWQRAEILGALINGVFLVALCVSIALEAFGRFISPPEISNPMVIVIVGSLGLLSNIVGLFLFHEHGHSHSHSHGPVHLPEDEETAEEPGRLRRERSDSLSSLYQHPAQTRAQVIETAHEFGYGRHADDSFAGAKSPPNPSHIRTGSQSRRKPTSATRSNKRSSGSFVPPAPGTNEVRTPQSYAEAASEGSGNQRASSPLARTVQQAEAGDDHDHSHDDGKDHGHSHGAGGHSHGSMNMRGVFLHVLGDALGNVGVIAAGLVIWFVHKRWALYFDPSISLVITCIILSSAWPLVKSASYILMQGVPSHVSLDAVCNSIRGVTGVVSVHELHIWQLSETTVVASVHVLIEPGVDYMEVASDIREVMHTHGIHSVTIQPEFYSEGDNQDVSEAACLIRCPPDQCGTDTCCPPATSNGKASDTEAAAGDDDHAGHSHEGHSH